MWPRTARPPWRRRVPPVTRRRKSAAAYGINQITFNNGTVAGDGSGTTIAIVDAYNDPNIANDLHQFDLAVRLVRSRP